MKHRFLYSAAAHFGDIDDLRTYGGVHNHHYRNCTRKPPAKILFTASKTSSHVLF